MPSNKPKNLSYKNPSDKLHVLYLYANKEESLMLTLVFQNILSLVQLLLFCFPAIGCRS